MRLSSPLSAFAAVCALVAGISCGGESSGTASSRPPFGDPVSVDTWSLENDRIRLTLSLDRTQGLRIDELRNLATDRDWSRAPQADTTLTVNGSTMRLGTNDGFRFVSAERSTDQSRTELRLTFEHAASRVRAVRHYVCYNGAPVIETFTVFQGAGASASVGPIDAWRVWVPPGEIRWLTGLDTPADKGDSFTLQHRTLAAAQRLELSAQERSTATVVPWLTIESRGEHFFGGLMWSGAWSMTIAATADHLEVSAGLPAMTTLLAGAGSVEGPHGFFGVASGDAGDVSRGMRDFFQFGLRAGRPLQPLITYNAWFARGAAIDEAITRQEIEHAAALNTELYVMDAGWYLGAAATDRFDFSSGLGRWVEDRERFPSGVRGMRDYAHTLGLKFGIWMEPERVALEVLGEDGMVEERSLATRDGRYDPATPADRATSAQICLADPDAKSWVLGSVFRVLEQVQPDYLKWDNNFWVNCNRAGHGHGATDGSFSHVRALYEILAAIRERYPDLLIENCSGGGHRLDFGLARYTDVAWMDDRTGPSHHVRHNLEGLTAAFPAPYLLSFVVGEAQDGSGASEDVPLLYRSRMPGVLGIGTGMSREQEEQAAREIVLYRELRKLQLDASTVPLTPQVGGADGAGWDALQQASASGDLAIFAFQTDFGIESIVLSPKGLDPDTIYAVQSADSGSIGRGTGADLAAQGIEVVASPSTAAHLLLLHPVSAPPAGATAAGAKMQHR